MGRSITVYGKLMECLWLNKLLINKWTCFPSLYLLIIFALSLYQGFSITTKANVDFHVEYLNIRLNVSFPSHFCSPVDKPSDSLSIGNGDSSQQVRHKDKIYENKN